MNFEQQYFQVKQQLYATALAYLHNPQDAEDILQETAISAWKNFKQLKDPSLFRTWITRILLNHCHKLYRKRKSNFLVQEKLAHNIDNTALSANKQYLPEDIYDNDEIALLDAISRLSEKHRRVILLKYFNDFQIKEIANILGIPQGTVKSRLHKAVEKLKQEMEADL